jgi:hypothetical protein
MTKTSEIHRRETVRRLAATASIGALTLLSGCAVVGGGTPVDATPRASTVASIKPTAPVAIATTQPAAVDRPLIRSDMSEADTARLYQIYYDCVMAHAPGLSTTQAMKQPPAAAAAACATKRPEEAWQRAKRLGDPKYVDEVHTWAACMTAHGIKAYEEDGNLMLQDGLPPASKSQWMNKCQAQAFGA